MLKEPYKRFESLDFENFRRMAVDPSLSQFEKIGFPDSYRENYESAIFDDIQIKLSQLKKSNQVVLDIGPGCSDLPSMLISLAKDKGHKLLLVDSEEMLSHLPDETFIEKYAAYYPKCDKLFDKYIQKVDVILCYSVFHYIFVETNTWEFLDRSLSLLANGGQMLIGDIPNSSKRKRFFSSENGVTFHKQFTKTDTIPEVKYNQIEHDKIDDGVLIGMLMRARNAGFDAYLLPQSPDLPMANRREDLLIVKP
jgi:hypothetical protein